MPPDYVILACVALALYFYINQNNQFRSTASAIRSVFTGECRMACRQSEASAFSGLSNLQGAGPSQNYGMVGPNCICASCPCPMIEHFIRTCSPATRMYTTFTAMLSQLYCSIIASIVGTTNYDSNENFSFKEHDNDENFDLKSPEITSKSLVQKKSSLATLKEKVLSKTSLISKKSVSVFFKDFLSKKRASDSSDEETMTNDKTEGKKHKASTSRGTGACPKCVEKGNTCLRECPNAKK